MTRCRSSAVGRAEGSASVWVLIACLVLAVAAAVSATVGAAVDLRHRAAVAADAAALAGAVEGGLVDGAACTAAGRAADANGARLTSCRVDGAVVDVRTRLSPPRWLAWLGVAAGRARAGPAPVHRSELGSVEISP